MNLNPKSLALLNSVVQQYNAHLEELSGEPSPYPFQPLQADNAYALVPLLMGLANVTQQAYPVTASEPNYAWEDLALNEIEDQSAAAHAFYTLLETL